MGSDLRGPTSPTPEETLPGRADPLPVPGRHAVLGTLLTPPYPDGTDLACFGMGCFWGAERRFWQMPGVFTTAVGYAGGVTPHPTYGEVCSGRTGHAEVVRVVFHLDRVPFTSLLNAFWEGHDPTQGMRQGNDLGTQYRSLLLVTSDDQRRAAEASRERYGRALAAAGFGPITTEVAPAGPFYFAEAYHQQYLAKHPDGYCGLGGTGVACPVGLVAR